MILSCLIQVKIFIILSLLIQVKVLMIPTLFIKETFDKGVDLSTTNRESVTEVETNEEDEADTVADELTVNCHCGVNRV